MDKKNLKDKRIAIVWRKSMYDNGFHCCACGKKCASDNGEVDDSVLTDPECTYLFCGNCKNVIAKVILLPKEEADSLPYMAGDYNEYLNRKKRT